MQIFKIVLFIVFFAPLKERTGFYSRVARSFLLYAVSYCFSDLRHARLLVVVDPGAGDREPARAPGPSASAAGILLVGSFAYFSICSLSTWSIMELLFFLAYELVFVVFIVPFNVSVVFSSIV